MSTAIAITPRGTVAYVDVPQSSFQEFSLFGLFRSNSTIICKKYIQLKRNTFYQAIALL